MYVFIQARPLNQRAFIAYNDLYQFLNLPLAKGKSYAWVDDNRVNWSALFKGAFGSDQIILNTYCAKDGAVRKRELDFDMRCLPESSVSMIGALLHLTSRWSQSSTWSGGLRHVESRENARHCLDAMIKKAMSIFSEEQQFSFSIEICSEWSCRWPRPRAMGVEFLQIIGSGDTVDIQPFVDRAKGPQFNSRVALWWNKLKTSIPALLTDTKVNMSLLVHSIYSIVALRPVYYQLIYAISVALVSSMARDCKAARLATPAASFACRTTFAWGIMSQSRQHMRLKRYIDAALAHNKSILQFGVCTDKGWANALPLQATLFTTSDNVISMACPVVIRCFGGLRALPNLINL